MWGTPEPCSTEGGKRWHCLWTIRRFDRTRVPPPQPPHPPILPHVMAFTVERIRAAGGDCVAGDVVVGGEEFSLTRAIGNSFVKVRPGCDYRDISLKQVWSCFWRSPPPSSWF